MNLKAQLESFSLKKIFSNIDTTALKEYELDNILDSRLKELAESFLYGGYISVRDHNDHEVYRIFLQTIEYYIHAESGCPIPIRDEIMYHRNHKNIEAYPYLPIMSLNPHDSGYDITFENEDEQYRASALIRQYVVIDMTQRCFLVWEPDSEKQSFVKYEESHKTTPINTQSTYLKKLLTGFSLESHGIHPVWIDIDARGEVSEGMPRKGVKSSSTQACHKWQFSRKSNYTLNDCLSNK